MTYSVVTIVIKRQIGHFFIEKLAKKPPDSQFELLISTELIFSIILTQYEKIGLILWSLW